MCEERLACSPFLGTRYARRTLMARLGTKARPAVIRAQTEERARGLFEHCTARGWDVIVGVEPEEPEDFTDMLKLETPEAFTV